MVAPSLDEVLQYLNELYDDHHLTRFKHNIIRNGLAIKHQKAPSDLVMILEYLTRKGFISKNDLGYIILYEGKVFIEQGGYKQEAALLDQETKLSAYIQGETLKNSRNLNRLTLILAVGTVGLLLFEIYKFCFEHQIVFVCH